MIVSPAELSTGEAEQLRAFERQGHDALAESYQSFFAAVTALAINPLFDDVHLLPGIRLLDVEAGRALLPPKPQTEAHARLALICRRG